MKLRDAWERLLQFNSRAPQGARGLKHRLLCPVAGHWRRAPQGARGLKLDGAGRHVRQGWVAPPRGRVD